MAAEFSQDILKKVVAQTCKMVGFHGIMTSPLEILVDILMKFICKLGQTAQHYAEHCGRSCFEVVDVFIAFLDNGLRPSDLLEFLSIVNPLPKSLPVPKYPVKKEVLKRPKEMSANIPDKRECREPIKLKISLIKIKEAEKSKGVRSGRQKSKKKST